MKQLLLVGLFGAIGAVSRFLVSAWTLRAFGDAFPLGTLIVNVVGCALIGVLYQLDASLKIVSDEWRVALAAGFLGGLTTFSTFGLETVRLIELGRQTIAATNVLANLALGLVSVAAGMALVRFLVRA
jgi:fluoride exporter